ncbi:MAG: hypothetical protein J6T13_03645 [Bacteroidales bacterium]|nr:hypothetical protein [Bacteroidales bacterium]
MIEGKIEENEKMKRKRTRIIALCAIILSACVVSLALAACNSPKQTRVEDEPTQTFPELLQRWVSEYDIDDPQRLALVDLVDSVYYLIIGSTVSAETLEEPICKMKKQIENVILNDSLYNFTQMMRASARYVGYGVVFDTNRNSKSLCKHGLDLVTNSFLWQTCSDESKDFMYTSLFGESGEAMERKANIILSTTDHDTTNMASIIITNFFDITMDNIRIAIDDEEGNPMSVIFEHDCFVDSSRADRGVKEMLIPLDLLMRRIDISSTWNITYETGRDTVTLAGVPNYFFNEQLKDCPRLWARMEKIRKSK